MSLRKSDAARHPLEGLLVNLLLIVALGLLLAGLTLPVLSLEKFYFFSNSVSLWSALMQLRAEREWGLVALLGSFSVLFPVIKLIWLFALFNLESGGSAGHRRHLHWLAVFARWSMLDVFVVALLVVSVKLGALAQARVELGIYAFAASVLLTMGLSAWIGREKKNRGRSL